MPQKSSTSRSPISFSMPLTSTPRTLGTGGGGSDRTIVVCDGDRVAGYNSLTVGQIDTLEAPERVRRGMSRYPIPLVILARLAVDLDHQKGKVLA